MSGGIAPEPDLAAEIGRSVAQIVLRLLPRIPRTDWRNRIVPFPAVYKKVGYVMKLDRRTTRRVLELLASDGRIRLVRFHGVVLEPDPRASRQPIQHPG